MRALVAVAIVLGLAAPATADQERVGYVARVLEAARTLGVAGRAALERELYTTARSDCRTTPQTIECLTEVARRVCKGDSHCELAADAVVTNLRAANDWVDQATRAALVRTATDYRAALATELRKRFAALAAELAVVDDRTLAAPELDANTGDAANRLQAAAIDHLCTTRDRIVHACRPGDAACVASISWSRCVAALVWYVGGTP